MPIGVISMTKAKRYLLKTSALLVLFAGDAVSSQWCEIVPGTDKNAGAPAYICPLKIRYHTDAAGRDKKGQCSDRNILPMPYTHMDLYKLINWCYINSTEPGEYGSECEFHGGTILGQYYHSVLKPAIDRGDVLPLGPLYRVYAADNKFKNLYLDANGNFKPFFRQHDKNGRGTSRSTDRLGGEPLGQKIPCPEGTHEDPASGFCAYKESVALPPGGGNGNSNGGPGSTPFPEVDQTMQTVYKFLEQTQGEGLQTRFDITSPSNPFSNGGNGLGNPRGGSSSSGSSNPSGSAGGSSLSSSGSGAGGSGARGAGGSGAGGGAGAGGASSFGSKSGKGSGSGSSDGSLGNALELASKYSGGGNSGSGSGGSSDSSGGAGGGEGGVSTEGVGSGSGTSLMSFGAASGDGSGDGTDGSGSAMLSEDPDDYFSLSKADANIFKIVHKRYQLTAPKRILGLKRDE